MPLATRTEALRLREQFISGTMHFFTIITWLVCLGLMSSMLVLELGRSLEFLPQRLYSDIQGLAGGDTLLHFYGASVLYLSCHGLIKATNFPFKTGQNTLFLLFITLTVGELSHIWLPSRAYQLEDLFAGWAGATVGWFLTQLIGLIKRLLFG